MFGGWGTESFTLLAAGLTEGMKSGALKVPVACCTFSYGGGNDLHPPQPSTLPLLLTVRILTVSTQHHPLYSDNGWRWISVIL
jgi:hypothetical protein